MVIETEILVYHVSSVVMDARYGRLIRGGMVSDANYLMIVTTFGDYLDDKRI